jgi:murein L,D-transpeptidase YafK
LCVYQDLIRRQDLTWKRRSPATIIDDEIFPIKILSKATVTAKAASILCTLLSLAFITSWCAAKPRTPAVEEADRIVVEKSARTMTLMHGAKVLKTYKVALSREPMGAKEREGDHKVPEGEYVVDSKNSHSRFHLALHISYPNATDRERARKLGVRPGGNIEIHGLDSKYTWVGSLQRQVDWTDGCIAVTNSEIEEIWPMVPVGTPVVIRP